MRKQMAKILTAVLLLGTLTDVSTAKAVAPKLNKSKLTLYIACNYTLKVKKASGKVKWTSGKKSVATVSSKGKVVAKKAGKAKITAKIGSKKLICRLTVKNRSLGKGTKSSPKSAYNNNSFTFYEEGKKIGIISMQLESFASGAESAKLAKKNSSNLVPKSIWNDVIEEANDVIDTDVETHLQGYDIDDKVLKIARDNAARAGVADLVHFQNRDVADLSHAKKYGFIITNPPYGERLEEKEALPQIYTALGNAFNKLDDWSAYVITPYEEIEKDFNKKATKKRKLYNGMIKTYYYQFLGPRPPKRRNEEKA